MAPKNLQDLLKYDIDNVTDSYEDICDIISNVDISAETNEANLKKAFNITKSLALKLNEENRVVLEQFEEETNKASKIGKLHSYQLRKINPLNLNV